MDSIWTISWAVDFNILLNRKSCLNQTCINRKDTVLYTLHFWAIQIWMTPKSLLWWWWKVVMMSATSLMIWVCLWLSLMLLLLHGIVVPVLFTRNIIAFLWKSRRASPARQVFSKDYSKFWSWTWSVLDFQSWFLKIHVVKIKFNKLDF